MASTNLSVTVPIQTGTVVGHMPTTVEVKLTPAEAKALWKIRMGFVAGTTQPSNTGVDRTIRLLLALVAANGSYA